MMSSAPKIIEEILILLHQLVLLNVCFIYPMSGQYSTNWDRKGCPGAEIQMYYGCPCISKLLR